jgi:outer membrane protein OmpA-like peptidoglycan-associated protein
VKPFILLLLVCLVPVLGRAQAVVHQSALDQLAGIAPPPAPAVKIVQHRAVVRKNRVVKRVPVAVAAVAPAAKVPPPTVVTPPPQAPAGPMDAQSTAVAVAALEAEKAKVAEQKFAAASSAPVVPMAVPKPPPAPAPLPGMSPITVKFEAGGDDLPGDAASSLQPVCKRAGADGIVAIDAYAPSDPGDPSAAMRLSLSRAFAVRDALTGCGIPAAHIIPRADGDVGGDTGIARVVLSGGVKTQ